MKRPVHPRNLNAAAAILFCLVTLLASNLSAEILVLRDGSRLETAGPWEVKGRQLVFKTASGTLSALRLSEVDLAASEKATAEAAAPKKEEVKPVAKKQPVLVLTDKDVAKASPEDIAAAANNQSADSSSEQQGQEPAASGKVEVTKSSIESAASDEFAFQVKGLVQNNSPVPVGNIKVLVTATVTRDGDNRRVFCEATPTPILEPKADVEFLCPIRRQDVLGTGMADAFGDAKLTFEVRSNPQAPAPPAKKPEP